MPKNEIKKIDFQFLPDHQVSSASREFWKPKYEIYLSTEISSCLLGENKSEGKGSDFHGKIWMRLGNLMSHGNTLSNIKGIKGENKGWLRIPLGGSGGNQYYLWFAKQGAPCVESTGLPKDAILIQSIRHHAENDKLLVPDPLEDCLPIKQEYIKGCFDHWTEQQKKFFSLSGTESPIRFLNGNPGSGKTATLHECVERGIAPHGGRVLYLTWSSGLVSHAEKQFETFAPKNVEVICKSFREFLGDVTGKDLEGDKRQGRIEFDRQFDRRIQTIKEKYRDLFFSQIHSVLVGEAFPGDEKTCLESGKIAHIKYEEYKSNEILKKSTVRKEFLDVFDSWKNEDGLLEKMFPESALATEAVISLQKKGIPKGYDDFDRVVIDEVQDLTLLDMAVVVEFCKALDTKRDYIPSIIVAGDESQTVWHSGFDWDKLSNLFSSHLKHDPEKVNLQHNLRSPKKIVDLIEGVAGLYKDLDKKLRPGDRQHNMKGESVNGKIFYLQVEDEEPKKLLNQLQERDGIKIVSAQDEVPEWCSENTILTPSEAKGLEYQTVCVLNPGQSLHELKKLRESKSKDPADYLRARILMDNLRVALSRSTESIIFMDVESTNEERDESIAILSQTAGFSIVFSTTEELLEEFSEEDKTVEEKVRELMAEANNLYQQNNEKSLEKAGKAFALLGNQDLPEGVSDSDLRKNVSIELLRGMTTGLVSEEGKREGFYLRGKEVLKELGLPKYEKFFESFYQWSEKQSEKLLPDFLESAVSIKEDWLKDSLSAVQQDLRKSIDNCSKQKEMAWQFSGNVDQWLELTGFIGDSKKESMELKRTAVDTLLDSGDLENADRVLSVIEPTDYWRTGKIREEQKRWEEAAEAFESAGTDYNKDAFRNWRTAGKWKDAARLAEGEDKDDMKWFVQLEQVANQRVEIFGRMTPKDREYVAKMVRINQPNLHTAKSKTKKNKKSHKNK
ncbi:hypothetical protein [Candidatus Mycalebacterium sp.]